MSDFTTRFNSARKTLKYNLEAADAYLETDKFKEVLLKLEDFLISSETLFLIAMGKNHPVADAAARTFRSLGRPAFAFDAADIPHGDLHLVRNNNLNIAISKSGTTDEIAYLVKQGAIDFLITSNFQVDYKHHCYVIRIPLHYEGDAYNIVPVTSPMIYLNFLNSVALSFAESTRGAQDVYEDFIGSHPGGQIGKDYHAS